MDEIVVFITASKEEEAAAIARVLVEEKLAGCVNVLPDIRSIYRWEGAIEDDREVLMIVKTRRNLFEQLQTRVKELHGYSVPEIIALPIVVGSPDYLAWLREATAR